MAMDSRKPSLHTLRAGFVDWEALKNKILREGKIFYHLAEK